MIEKKDRFFVEIELIFMTIHPAKVKIAFRSKKSFKEE